MSIEKLGQPRGVRDFFAKKTLLRESIIRKIRDVYELYGFEPMHTPAFERMEMLYLADAGDEVMKGIYRVVSPDRAEGPLGLRFDLTVPLARALVQAQSLRLPFRRYQVGSVWRGEKSATGRYREFLQFDLDAVGVAAEVGDTEIIAAMCDTLKVLDVGPFEVRVSSRRILQLLLDFAGIPREQGPRVFAAIDKLEKIDPADKRAELTELGLSQQQADGVEEFLRVDEPRRADALDRLRELFAHVSGAAEEIGALDRISRHLYALDYGDDVVRIDVSVARGLGYYTSTIFETSILEARHYGSVFSGGRYDDLIERYAGKKIPATGASIGVDRLVEAMLYIRRREQPRATARVLVVNFDSEFMSDYLQLTWELRRAKIPTELYLGTERMNLQLNYAKHRGIPIALLYGPKERAAGTVAIKNIGTAQAKEAQWEVPRAAVVETVAKLVNEIDGG